MEKFFWSANKKWFKNMWKHPKDCHSGDDYTTDCLVDYNYFKNYYKMIAIDLTKQQVFNGGLRAIQQINFTVNLDWRGETATHFIIEETKETVLNFLQGTVKLL